MLTKIVQVSVDRELSRKRNIDDDGDDAYIYSGSVRTAWHAGRWYSRVGVGRSGRYTRR